MALTREYPAPRVGQLLSAARHRHGRSEQDVAIAVGVPLRLVRRWERGLELPTDDQVERLAALYGEPAGQLLPVRDVASLDAVKGTLTVGTETVDVEIDEDGNEGLLQRYVSLVRRQRRLKDDAVLDLRDEDIGALASVLDLTDRVLHQRLERIVGLTAAEAAEVAHKMRRWRYLAPVAGLAVGALALFGITQALGSKDATDTPSAPTVSEAPPSGAPAVVADTPAGSTVTVPAITAAPSAPASTTAAPLTQSNTTARGRANPAPTTRSLAPSIGTPLTVSPTTPVTPAPTPAPTTVPGAVAVPGDNNDPSVTPPPTSAPETTTTIPVDIGDGGATVTAP